MKYLFICILMLCVCSACSLPPERPFTREELYRTSIYTYFTINDSPESVLAVLNREGEAILSAKYRGRAVWIKILGKNTGLSVQIIEKD